MKEVKIFNSYGNKLEVFKPIKENEVSMYVCGPTVYDEPHIGNMRPVIVFDVWRRLFLSLGYKVTYVSNYTDVDDKIIKRAKLLGISEKELTDNVIKAFRKDVDDVNSLQPDFTPAPTAYMDKIISYVKDLVDTGHAYVSDQDVYFSVSSVSHYGELSGNTVDSLISGARIDINSSKESPLDFALWKKTDEGIKWNSPFGEGRPGWHTECCVMINSIFSSQNGLIDIHGGGFDLKFPHHENEIAQSRAHNGNRLANYWIHNGFINIDNQKMSKSLGNVLSAKEVIAKWGGMPFRLMVLNTHYRSPLSFTNETIEEATRSYSKIASTFKNLAIKLQLADVDLKSLKGEGEDSFFEEMCNDLNTPNALTIVYGELKADNMLLRNKNASIEELKNAFAKLQDYLYVLGIKVDYPLLNDEDKKIYKDYTAAKEAKDFAKSDELRNELIKRNIF